MEKEIQPRAIKRVSSNAKLRKELLQIKLEGEIDDCDEYSGSIYEKSVGALIEEAEERGIKRIIEEQPKINFCH